jgi:UPF0755 protein
MNKKILRISIITIGILAIFVAGIIIVYKPFFGAPEKNSTLEQFTVPLPIDRNGGRLIDFELAKNLKERGFIKNEWAFKLALGKTEVHPGAYKFSKSMSAWKIAAILKKEPYMKWVVIPEGFRKEQIVELLAKELNWSDDIKNKWVTTYTAMKYDEIEGVYFPDTYLIPVNEEPLKVADRLRAKFNEKFQPYAEEALKQNMMWTTLLKLASLVQREAGGKDDMPIIAGILWNRLDKGMKLEIDATIQYINDSGQNYQGIQCDEITPCNNQEIIYTGLYAKENGWWQPIKSSDIQKTSSYNTYQNKGLPPQPICNPGIEAINAALNSVETECLFYLHDSERQIHCAKTYEEHKTNIETYLK